MSKVASSTSNLWSDVKIRFHIYTIVCLVIKEIRNGGPRIGSIHTSYDFPLPNRKILHGTIHIKQEMSPTARVSEHITSYVSNTQHPVLL